MQIKKYANVTIEFPTGREEEELLRLDESAFGNARNIKEERRHRRRHECQSCHIC
jgi:hypothetical protein